jgi:glycosyltransferase involved in cell wall biosynthesis
LLLPIDKYVLSNSDKIIAISDKMKSYLVKTRNIDPDQIEVVYNWQNEDAFENYHNQNKISEKIDNSFTFMYMGNIGPVAGVDLLIEAFIKADMKNCRLVIAGSGSMKHSLEKKVESLKEVSIEFRLVPEGKVPEIQDIADVLLLPIKRGAALSSIPSKLPAYMFSKKAVIASVDEQSDTANAIREAECGWIILPENVNLLAEKMKAVAALSKEELNVYGEKGFTYALERFSKKTNLNKIVDIITTVAEKNVLL